MNEIELYKEIVQDLMSINSVDSFDAVVKKHMGFCSRENNLWLFTMFWFAIPEQYLYGLYKDNLTMTECGSYYSHFFKNDILEKIMKLNKHDTVNNTFLQKLADKDGYITIYHGHCKPTLRNSNSWTLNKDIAKFLG